MSDRRHWWRNTARKLAFRPRCEPLEGRDVPAVITVTNTGDSPVIGSGSLRAAILEANTTAESDTVQFAIPGTGVQTIQPGSPLPSLLDDGIFLDGWTQGGSGYTGPPLIEVDGSAAGVGAFGFTVISNANTIRGLVVNRFDGFGIYILGGSGNAVVGNYVGTTADGTTAAGNGGSGVVVEAAVDTTVGGATAADRNVISGNGDNGVDVVFAVGTAITGNYIGLNAAGTAAVGNGFGPMVISGNGISVLDGSADSLIQGNVISGNAFDGVEICMDGATGNLVTGNLLGTNAAGTAALGNGEAGVLINTGATLNTVSGNTVGGNQFAGVILLWTTGNVVTGNVIGTPLLPNAGPGVLMSGAAEAIVSGNTITGNAGSGISLDSEVPVLGLSSGNLISGNLISGNRISGGTAAGIELSDPGTSGNLIVGNFIGTNAAGTAADGNDLGIWVTNEADANTIGGAGAGANVISGNVGDGVQLTGVSGTSLPFNFIGTDLTGAFAVPNGGAGVVVAADASGNTVGAEDGVNGNLISGNTGDGVVVAGTGNVVAGNFIGTNNDGDAALPNGGVGVRVTGAGNTVGSLAVNAGNVISGNTAEGVRLTGTGATGNVVVGNYIGTDAAGTAKIGNTAGVLVANGANANTVGGTAATAGNLVSGNASGVVLLRVSGVLVAGNTVGLSVAGNALGNSINGIGIVSASNNSIGGSAAGAGNVISGNGTGTALTDGGVVVGRLDPADPVSSGNLIAGNRIGTDATGASARPNVRGVSLLDGATNNTVSGSVISGNTGVGVLLSGAGATGNVLAGNSIGLTVGGTALANDVGVRFEAGASANTVGPGGFANVNVISGNANEGVVFTGAGTSANVFSTNIVGASGDGTAAVPNGGTGVLIETDASANTVGSSAAGQGNVISGNGGNGVLVAGNNNAVLGNFIGTRFDGTTAIPNDGFGVIIHGSGNTVAGMSTTPGQRQIISGNAEDGVVVSQTGSGNVIRGNLIGTNAAGTAALPNGGVGVGISGANNIVGGSGGLEGNLISGNAEDGVRLIFTTSTGNLVVGNFIGTNAAGTAALANGTLDPGNDIGSGVAVADGARNNTVGGTAAGFANLLSGNVVEGVTLIGTGTTGNVVAGNLIGTDVSGTQSISNGYNGVGILNGAAANTVGGTALGAGNVISGNRLTRDVWGVYLGGAGAGNLIQQNLIGTTADGTGALPNGVGVVIDEGTTGTLVVDNIISGNDGFYLVEGDGAGVVVAGAGTAGNVFRSNTVGLDASGIGLPNAGDGIAVRAGSTANTVGGVGALGNTITGNTGAGVRLTGGGTTGNVLIGNFVGVNAAGAPVGNSIGVLIDAGASANSVGPGPLDQSNVISGNAAAGVQLRGTATTRNLIGTNYIGTDSTGAFALANGGYGVDLGDSGGNTVGSFDVNAGNLISGNGGGGVFVGGTGNTVVANFIGLNDAGDAALPNVGNGIDILGNNNTVSAQFATAGFRQAVSGNTGDGIVISGTGNLVVGTLIGTDRLGTAAVPNGGVGIRITGSANTVGGANAADAVLVSGNAQGGIVVSGSAAAANVLSRVLVGLGADASTAIGNGGVGVRIAAGANGNTLGGTGNAVVVSGNAGDGVRIAGSSGNLVVGVAIGTDLAGEFARPNAGNGVSLDASASGNSIGTTARGNLISGNAGDGVSVAGSGNLIAGNYVGLSDFQGAGGTPKPLPNGGNGITITGNANTVGGNPQTGGSQVVAGNVGDGIVLAGAGNLVQQNDIGVSTDATGTPAVPNGGAGVRVTGSGNTVGGANAYGSGTTGGNLISGNTGPGVMIVGAGATGNVVTGNFVGTDGTAQAARPNGGAGVLVQDAAGNSIGSRVPARAANVISGNAGDGVRITGAAATGNAVLGNSVGVDRTASFAVGNGGDGVRVVGADGTTVGGIVPNSTNIIGGNAGAGVRLLAGADRSEVSNNYLGLDLAQTAGIPNQAGGVVIDGSSSNTVGGVVPDAANFISGNLGGGVLLRNQSNANLVAGNLIGTNGDGTGGVPNLVGVFIASSANNTVQSNVIAFNAGTGVVVGSSPADVTAVGNRVTTNSIFSNSGLGIDLGNDGPTPNGVNPRAFPNRGQNYPVLTLAGVGNGTAVVVGTFQSIPNTTFRIEFFANANGGTQAQTFVGDLIVTTDAAGFAAVRFSTTNPAVIGGTATLTATATNTATGDTSETSNAVAVPVIVAVTLSPPTLPPGVAGTTYSQQLTAAGGAGGPYTFTVTAGVLPPGLTLSTAGALAGTPTAAGSFPFVVTATDPLGNAGQQVYALQVAMSPPPPPAPVQLLAVGTGAGGGPRVVVYNPDRTVRFDFFAFDVDFRGGVTVATGDITGDGIDDIVAGAGDGGGPEVRVFDGATGNLVSSFFAYDPNFRNGVNVAVGDVTGDGTPDIVTGAGPGGSAHVKVFDGRTGAEVRSFFAFDPAFRGGATVAAGDTNGDGSADIIAGAAAGGGPRVEVYDGATGALLQSFFAYASTFTGGVYVAAGDLTGDGLADILAGPGVGGGPVVTAFDGPTLGQIFAVELQQVAAAGGATVAAWDFDGDGIESAVGGGGPGGAGRVVVLAPEGSPLFDLLPFGEFLGGAFVG